MDRNRLGVCHYRDDVVALRKESVDRNSIEPANLMVSTVALRKESVDRNECLKLLAMLILGRSPQGERG